MCRTLSIYKRVLLEITINLFSLGAIFTPFLVQAVPVNFSGTLIDNPPCTVNNSQTIDVPFGEIGINKIDGVNYTQLFTLTLNCHASLGGVTSLYLDYTGIPAYDFDEDALQTNLHGLGIRLYRSNGSMLFSIDSGYNILLEGGSITTLDLYAVPVKQAGVDLPEGDFTATATFELQYP